VRAHARRLETQVAQLMNKDDFYERICIALIQVAQIDNALIAQDENDKK
jgi:hypothetical protein